MTKETPLAERIFAARAAAEIIQIVGESNFSDDDKQEILGAAKARILELLAEGDDAGAGAGRKSGSKDSKPRTRRTKAEIEADKKAAAEAKAAEEKAKADAASAAESEADTEADSGDAPTGTLDDLKAAARDAVKAGREDVLVDLQTEYGVEKLSQAGEDKFGEIVGKIRDAISGGDEDDLV